VKQQIKIWGSRVIILALLIYGGQRWGEPIYKQYFTPKKVEVFVPTGKARSGKFLVSFHEVGALQAEKSVPVTSDVQGKIITILPEGTIVKPADIIAVLDPTDLKRQRDQQVLQYNNSQADVERTKAQQKLDEASYQTDLDQATAEQKYNDSELSIAKQVLEKKKALLDEKLIAGAEVDEAEGNVRSRQLTVDKGKLQYALKEKEIESKKRQKQSEVSNMEFRQQMAKMQLDEFDKQMKSTTITAPAPGMLVLAKTRDPNGWRPFAVGDTVYPRTSICTLPDLSSMIVKVAVGETDIPKVTLGLRCLVRLDAIPNKTFHGSIKNIASLATEQDIWQGGGTPGKKIFDVTIALDEADPKTLKPGMSADVEFVCESIAKALYVPIEAVIERDGKTLVYVKDGKKFERRVVKAGKRNDNDVCITKGLAAGDVIALRDPTRSMDEQEAGGAANPEKEANPKDKKTTVPIPGS
jgi:RND family efflux transporter MFP subunit